MRTISALKLGIAVSAVVGSLHLAWALLVMAQWAQPVIDFVFWMHFVRPAFRVEAFDPATAAILVAITSAVGFVGGYALGLALNWLRRPHAENL